MTPQPDRIPSVFLIGAAKSGTTALASYLGTHPRISLGSVKEPQYFSDDERYARGRSWYASHYTDSRVDDVLIDATTDYTRYPLHPETARRIRAAVPDAKLIYIMRHPVERAYSHFVHRWMREVNVGQPFTMNLLEYAATESMVLDSSDYRSQLLQYLAVFDESRLLCLSTDELHQGPGATSNRVARFLGLDPVFDDAGQFAQHNVSEDFVAGRTRSLLAENLWAHPVAGRLAGLVPGPVRRAGLSAVERSPAGRRTRETLLAPPLTPTDRELLLERFDESTRWVEEFTGTPRPDWHR